MVKNKYKFFVSLADTCHFKKIGLSFIRFYIYALTIVFIYNNKYLFACLWKESLIDDRTFQEHVF